MSDNGVNNSDREQNSICLKNGRLLELQGVLSVDDFDKAEVRLTTNLGPLIVCGQQLHIAQLLPESEALTVEGEIQSIAFAEFAGRTKKGGLLRRLTR